MYGRENAGKRQYGVRNG